MLEPPRESDGARNADVGIQELITDMRLRIPTEHCVPQGGSRACHSQGHQGREGLSSTSITKHFIGGSPLQARMKGRRERQSNAVIKPDGMPRSRHKLITDPEPPTGH